MLQVTEEKFKLLDLAPPKGLIHQPKGRVFVYPSGD